ncbi:MAG: NAD-dependent epimerase/dehydratase family protein, partial [Acidimicrobiales bacterium]
MRIIVSGSTGLIGSALGPALAAAGHEVVRLSRRTPG